MKSNERWAIAIQIWRDGVWSPLFGLEFPTRAKAIKRVKKHIIWAERRQLDPRNIAVYSWSAQAFEVVPWL